MQKHVLVVWIVKAAADGRMRYPGDEDVLNMKKAKFLKSAGMIRVIGDASYVVPRLALADGDGNEVTP